jgi:predicted TIM-barrel fold metal-dependent hydrolase
VTDCDVHNALRSPDDIRAYLPQRWRDLPEFAGPGSMHAGWAVGAAARPSVFRTDTVPEHGPPGSDLDLMREQLLDPYGIDRAIIHPILDTLLYVQHGELGAALARAMNDLVSAEWLDAEPRLFGAITVPIEDGNLAAAEIERAAADRRFVKVLVTSLTREPLGHSKYWPMYEAAVAHGLPVAAHVGGFSGVQNGSGWNSYFVEQHANFVLGYAAQLISLIHSGVFERFPDLQIVFEEAGLAWFAPTLWRLDRAWTEMREGSPQLQEPPSAIARRHFWITTQPLDEPEKHEYLVQMLDHLDMDDRILFSSDYPHHDFDDPRRVLSASLIGAERRQKIFSDNASRLFRIPADGSRTT